MAKVASIGVATETDASAVFPHLDWASREQGVSPDALIRIFLLEKAFHERITITASADDRGRMYNELYSEVHRLKREGAHGESHEGTPEKYARLVLTFRRELTGKSVLDVGCGDGLFLNQVARLLQHGELWGIDTSETALPREHREIHFLCRDIVAFTVPRQFDIVYSHQVLEHIAPADVTSHLESIQAALKPGGKLIVMLPNRFWGPQDITRIVDNTFTGRLPAQGSHLNEGSYTELVPQLEAFGFRNIRTILPFAQYLPPMRDLRVKPWLNRFFERHAVARGAANLVRLHGRPVFRNPIVLIAEKQ